MSSLTTGLALLGGATLVALVGWNAWTTRRHAPRQPEAAAPGAEADTEPMAAPADADPNGRLDPTLDAPGAAAADSPLGPLPVPERRPGLDALIDVIAPIALESPVSGDAVLAAVPATRRVGSKPFAVEGQDPATGAWEAPLPGRRYTALQAGLQLANRNGALNEIEFSEFVVRTQGFADALNGTPEFPDMRHEVARARELDQFAGAHDAQLSLTLRARSAAWSPGYVQQHAARLGFVAGVIPGRMVLPSSQAGAPPVLVLTFDTQAALAEDPTQAALLDITLSVDVPQVPRSEQPFVRMREAAGALGAAMEGVLTDDQGHPIPAEALDAIGADLEQLYDTLDARDLSAGSAQARRLFS